MKIYKKFYKFLLVGLLLIVFSGNVNADTYSFSVSSTFEDHDIFNFTVNNVGTIFTEATWTGSASNLVLILNRPGQKDYYLQEYGTSPLSLSYTVTSADLSKGKDWSISIVNFEKGNANGTVMIKYPKSQMTPYPTPAPHTPQVTATPAPPTPQVTATPAPHTPQVTATPVPPTPQVTATPAPPTPQVTATPAPPTPQVTATPASTPQVTATPAPTPQVTATQGTLDHHIPGFLTLFSLIAIFLVYYKNR